MNLKIVVENELNAKQNNVKVENKESVLEMSRFLSDLGEERRKENKANYSF